MTFTLKQRKQIKDNGSLLLANGIVEITYGKVNAHDHVELCDYKYDGYECNRFGVHIDGELVLISNTWTKLQRFLSNEMKDYDL